MPPVFRFAPSPNGALHLGHALSALLNAEAARDSGGRLLLRIEDIDRERCRPEYEAGILADLDWLGVAFERPVRRQSEHFPDYAAALERLRGMGLVYPSFATRGEIRAAIAGRADWPHDPDCAPLYPGFDRELDPATAATRVAAGEPFALRLDVAKAIARAGPLAWQEAGRGLVDADPAAWGDVVLARKDAPASYHLAVVVDDALQGVSDIVRGVDLFQATAIHRLLQALLELPEPVYRHHRLILGDDGRKLSKSSRSTSLAALREAGAVPDDIRRLVGFT